MRMAEAIKRLSGVQCADGTAEWREVFGLVIGGCPRQVLDGRVETLALYVLASMPPLHRSHFCTPQSWPTHRASGAHLRWVNLTRLASGDPQWNLMRCKPDPATPSRPPADEQDI